MLEIHMKLCMAEPEPDILWGVGGGRGRGGGGGIAQQIEKMDPK